MKLVLFFQRVVFVYFYFFNYGIYLREPSIIRDPPSEQFR